MHILDTEIWSDPWTLSPGIVSGWERHSTKDEQIEGETQKSVSLGRFFKSEPKSFFLTKTNTHTHTHAHTQTQTHTPMIPN